MRLGNWWLRSPNNNNSNNARNVNNSGNIGNNNVNNSNNGVRADLSYEWMSESTEVQDDILGKILVL